MKVLEIRNRHFIWWYDEIFYFQKSIGYRWYSILR